MNKWYKSAPCKGILLVFEHIFAVTMAVCLIWTLSFPGQDLVGMFTEKPKKNYADAEGFENQLQDMAGSVVWAIPYDEMVKTDGAYDENKIVDIKEYAEQNSISGENKSGLAYRLGDLLQWTDAEVYYGYSPESGGAIIVCEKRDGTYRYYYNDDFQRNVEAGKLVFGDQQKEYGSDIGRELMNALLSGEVFQNIMDDQGNLVYEKCWVYDGGWLQEECAPIGGENILEVVNEQPEWNGRLDEAMSSVSETVQRLSSNEEQCKNVMSEWEEGNSNAVYLVVDQKTGKRYSNRTEYRQEDWKKSIESMKKLGKYVVVTPKLVGFESNMEASARQWRGLVQENIWLDDYVCAFAVDTEYPVQDTFYQESKVYVQYAPFVRSVLVTGVISAILTLAGLVWLTIISGRSNREEGVVLMAFDKIKTELFVILSGGLLVLAGCAGIAAVDWVFSSYYGVWDEYSSTYRTIGFRGAAVDIAGLALIGVVAALICSTGLIFWLGMTRRCKAHTIWSNSVLKWLVGFADAVLQYMSIIWKAALAFAGFMLIHWIAVMTYYDSGIGVVLMLAADVAAFVCLVRNVIGKNRIKKGVQAIAGGQVEYQIPLNGLKGEQLEVAECINKIGDGLERALEESMKNERLKTDLITNVSHDIKTPLTSIINYVELLKREQFDDPKIQNYIKVLEEKAYRLKTLTEDVVEASKVSSGNVKLDMMNLNLVELINQTSAEFEEKFRARNLNLIVNMPDEPVTIYADGRRMWRVLANIFNNAAKYAMEGSRIYADLFRTEKEVQFTLKNVSEQPLNISAEELTERFVRGDVSRSTEGSGLGLSIAQNLTRLQGGSFELYLDGDLFKVVITFPA